MAREFKLTHFLFINLICIARPSGLNQESILESNNLVTKLSGKYNQNREAQWYFLSTD